MTKLTIRNLSRTLKYSQDESFYGKRLYGRLEAMEAYKYLKLLGLLNGTENFVYDKVSVELTHEEFIRFIELYNKDLIMKTGCDNLLENSEIKELMLNKEHKLLLWE